MMRYRITLPDGQSTTAELNQAAALLEVQRGNRVEVLGLSPISQRVNAVREAALLMGRNDLTDDELNRATELIGRYGMTLAELGEALEGAV